MSSVRVQRTNLVVADLERALGLYRDVLGFRVEFTKESSDASYSYPVFEIAPAASLRFCVLSTPTQPRVLALTEVRGMDLPDRGLPRPTALVVETPDLDGVVAAATDAGLVVHPEGRLHTHDGRVGREVGIVDPDGHLVVCYVIGEGR